MCQVRLWFSASRFSGLLFLFVLYLATPQVRATVFGQIRGIVHDPQHRPIKGASVTIHAAHSAFVVTATTDTEGRFSVPALPAGDYIAKVEKPGFAPEQLDITLASDTSPVLHFELRVAGDRQTVTVHGVSDTTNVDTATPTTLVSREDIAQTPGADRTNSLAMITDYVPGAYMTHDMLHMRGGHQVSWLVDGVQIPNTNIASNVGAEIDPKDIDYIEVQRGSYTSDLGDRTFGVFNVVPRTGFERSRQAELVLSAGSFSQTNGQFNFGDHSEKLAYYASVSGNRSDYGLSTPIGQIVHDATHSYGGFGSLIYNRTAANQLRVIGQFRKDNFDIPYDPDPTSVGNQQFDSSGLRDSQHETDGIAAFSWVHTFHSSAVLQVSPFFHYNHANYESAPDDTPVASTVNRGSIYAGGQASLVMEVARNTLQTGVSAFGQHDNNLFGAIFNDGSGNAPFTLSDAVSGAVTEEYVSDSYKLTPWMTLLGGVRVTQFKGVFTETGTAPRAGAAVRLPKLNWVFRGFYGRYYQPPPLLTASGPIVQFAKSNNTDFEPLHGERDEEHQFGVQIPLHGWLLDADTFKTRINNFLDHSTLGNSSLYFPITVDGALIRAWELSLRSPRLWNLGQLHLAYANQIAQQRGRITGGLVCIPVGDPACDAGFTYRPVDHDQRNTLNAGFYVNLPWNASASMNAYYGSGFTNGGFDPQGPPADPRYPNAYLPSHTTFDLSFGKHFGERFTASVTATNVENRRVLIDNSLTFGGFHYNDPREIFGEVRYRFHY